MNKRNSMIITILALAVGVGGLTFGFKSKANYKNLEAKYALLEGKLTASATGDELEFDIPTSSSLGDDTLIAGYLRTIEDLEQQLAQSQTLATRGNRRGADATGMPAMPEGMDATAMQEQMAQRMEQQRAQQEERMNTFANWDTSGMTQDEIANHNALMDVLAAIQDPNADRTAMRDTMVNMREMMATEQNAMINQLGEMSDDDRAAAMDEINQMTGGMMMGGRGGRGGGMGGMGGGMGGMGGF